ncbi:MAG: SDR family NAD(P)-dependent oxidoreductase [Pseudomonadota bacterium]
MSFAHYPSLKDRTVLVTGGASGIGADIVRAFAGQGARVGFLDIQREAGAALALETNTAFESVDITDVSALKGSISALENRLGPVHALINNAANDQRQDVADIADHDWDKSQNINLRAQFFAAQAVRAGMATQGGGSIINISSVVWRLAGGDMVPYATAKAGVLGLTKSLAHAFGADNIRVNAIEPGAIFTERQRALWYPTEEDVNALVSQQLLKQVMDGGEIARMALFLASDDARMITKQSFIVDAGLI